MCLWKRAQKKKKGKRFKIKPGLFIFFKAPIKKKKKKQRAAHTNTLFSFHLILLASYSQKKKKSSCFFIQWLRYRLHCLQFRRFGPASQILRRSIQLQSSLSLARRRMIGEFAGDCGAKRWFSRPCKELPPLTPRRWRDSPPKNLFFSPWVFVFLLPILYFCLVEINLWSNYF